MDVLHAITLLYSLLSTILVLTPVCMAFSSQIKSVSHVTANVPLVQALKTHNAHLASSECFSLLF